MLLYNHPRNDLRFGSVVGLQLSRSRYVLDLEYDTGCRHIVSASAGVEDLGAH